MALALASLCLSSAMSNSPTDGAVHDFTASGRGGQLSDGEYERDVSRQLTIVTQRQAFSLFDSGIPHAKCTDEQNAVALGRRVVVSPFPKVGFTAFSWIY